MPDLKCIYCLNDMPTEEFNTEHVISRAFGTFENNLTLIDLVCRPCNQFFGDHLEVVFARDSSEAYDRIARGFRPVEHIRTLPQRRLTFTLAQSGELEGLRLALIAEGGAAAVTFEPQVGLPKTTSCGWSYLTEPELADHARPLPADFDRQGHIRVIGPTDDVRQRLIDLLAERGIRFRPQGDFPLPQPEGVETDIHVNMQIDPVVKRCIAKYAFNYMAYVTGRDFALLPSFNATRHYIREGISPDYLVVVADDRPILATDSRTRRQTDGHLLTLNWTPDKRNVVAQLSLFNRVTYRVSLARNFSGLWRPIHSGHHFDICDRRISPLATTSLYVPGTRFR